MTTTESLHEAQLMRFAADVVLRNGTTLRLRPVVAADVPRILDFLNRLSPDTLELRFCGARRPDLAMARGMALNDVDGTFGLVGEFAGEIVAIAHYYRLKPGSDVAEVAFTISEVMQGLGVGTRLLERLADVGREHGIRAFTAEVLPQNHPMIKVFLDCGFDIQESSDGEQLHFEMLIEETESYEDRSADRAQQAATASMKPIFAPRSIAVIGAGRHRGHMGAELFRNLIRNGFHGKLYPVNPAATEVEYVPSFASVRDIPGEVDLAFIVVPEREVEQVVDDCVAKGVHGIMVMTGGFGEAGDEGRAREMRLVEKIRAAGMRMIGPNAMGVLNTDPQVRMHGTFTPIVPPSGTVAMSTQSGALGLATLDYARQLNIGFSTFVSVGNKADVSGNDLIQYWADDPRTEVILLYLESFGNPKRFSRIARRVARKKPIVAVKSGRSLTGARAAFQHTGARAASDAIVADLFRQAGIIRTDTLEEMFDVATLLANQPLPIGRRVAIVTNAGGPAVLAADACEAHGLTLANLSDETMSELRAFLPSDSTMDNPVNIGANAPAEHYWRTMEVLLDDSSVDALIVIHIPVFAEELDSVARGIKEGAAASNGKPVIGTIMSAQGMPVALAPLPCFPFPERAVAALARVTSYSEWRRRPAGRIPEFSDIDFERARGIIKRAIASNRSTLSTEECRDLLETTGIEMLESTVVATVNEAVDAARKIEGPVVMKAIVTSLRREIETAAVKQSLVSEDAIRAAWAELTERFGARLRAIAVQKMASEGADVMFGVTEQPTFGHLLYYGIAAAAFEVAPDVTFRFHPLTDIDASDMLHEARCTAALQRNVEYHGGEGRIADALLRLSALLDGCPEIREMEVTPVVVTRDRLLALEAHIKVGRPEVNGVARRVLY